MSKRRAFAHRLIATVLMPCFAYWVLLACGSDPEDGSTEEIEVAETAAEEEAPEEEEEPEAEPAGEEPVAASETEIGEADLALDFPERHLTALLDELPGDESLSAGEYVLDGELENNAVLPDEVRLVISAADSESAYVHSFPEGRLGVAEGTRLTFTLTNEACLGAEVRIGLSEGAPAEAVMLRLLDANGDELAREASLASVATGEQTLTLNGVTGVEQVVVEGSTYFSLHQACFFIP